LNVDSAKLMDYPKKLATKIAYILK
jgi:hypothetical protein